MPLISLFSRPRIGVRLACLNRLLRLPLQTVLALLIMLLVLRSLLSSLLSR